MSHFFQGPLFWLFMSKFRFKQQIKVYSLHIILWCFMFHEIMFWGLFLHCIALWDYFFSHFLYFMFLYSSEPTCMNNTHCVYLLENCFALPFHIKKCKIVNWVNWVSRLNVKSSTLFVMSALNYSKRIQSTYLDGFSSVWLCPIKKEYIFLICKSNRPYEKTTTWKPNLKCTLFQLKYNRICQWQPQKYFFTVEG